MIKTTRLLFAVVATLFSGFAMAQKIICPNVAIEQGGTAELVFSIESDQPSTLAEFFLTMPEGILIEKNSRGRYLFTKGDMPTDDHTVTVTDKKNGDVYVLLKNEYGDNFKSNSGTLITLPIVASSNISGGTYQIKVTGANITNQDPRLINTGTEFNINVTVGNPVKKYTISFDSNGGTNVGSISGAEGETVIAPTNPTKTGYSFVGWTPSLPSVFPAADMSVTAQWKINQYTITFDTDGGSAIAPITQDYQSAVTAPANPTKAGYTFAGWNQTIPTTMPAGNVTIKALWNGDEISTAPRLVCADVTVQQGGTAELVFSIESDQPSTLAEFFLTMPEGILIEKNSRGRYLFTKGDMPTDDHTVTVTDKNNGDVYVLLKNEYGDNFKSNSGTLITLPIVASSNISGGTYQIKVTGANITNQDPRLINTGTEFNINVTVGNPVKKYTISFDSNGGTNVGSISGAEGETVIAPTNPTKTGYSFVGWTPSLPSVFPAADMSVTAQWKINQYTITFDTDGGSAIAPITQDYQSAVTAPANPTKAGYTFAGWNQTIPTTMPAGNVTIKALWNGDEISTAPRLVCADVTVQQGGTAELVFSIESDQPSTLAAFFLTMPEGISIEKNSKGRYLFTKGDMPTDDHTVTVTDKNNGDVYVLLKNEYGDNFKSNSGTLITLPIVASSNISGGTYQIKVTGANITNLDPRQINTETEFNINVAVGMSLEDIVVNETNFPDANFRNWILSKSYGEDGILTEEEIAGVTSMDVSPDIFLPQYIQSLKGIEYFTALEDLLCSDNKLSTIDLSKNIKLSKLDCSGNQLVYLDLSENTALKDLNCSNNKLTSLIVSSAVLSKLYCFNNKLTSLDVSKNTALRDLNCSNNQLTSLDLSKNEYKYLNKIQCYKNQIKGEGMSALVRSLPNHHGEINVIIQSNDGNVMTTAQVTRAKAKGWVSMSKSNEDDWDWSVYAGSKSELILGDANNDGRISMSDIMYVLNYVFGNPPQLFSVEAADVNLDNEINMTDIVYIVQYILYGKFPE